MHHKLRRFSSRLSISLHAYLFLAPSFIILVTFVFLPMIYAFLISLTRWDLLSPVKVFVGLKNYTTLVRSAEFWQIARNTLVYTVGTVPSAMAIGLTLALVLNRKIRFRGFFRAAYFIPYVTSVVAVAIIWRWIYHPNYGLMNALLNCFGIRSQKWLSDPKQALLAVIIVSIWRDMGYNMVIYLAGLQGIPSEYYEAARIDGATRSKTTWFITWPLLAPTTFFILITSMIRSMQVFTVIHAMTGGGPVNSTNVLVYYLYQKAFQSFRVGYAFAVAYVLFCVIFLLTLVNWKFARRRMEYS